MILYGRVSAGAAPRRLSEGAVLLEASSLATFGAGFGEAVLRAPVDALCPVGLDGDAGAPPEPCAVVSLCAGGRCPGRLFGRALDAEGLLALREMHIAFGEEERAALAVFPQDAFPFGEGAVPEDYAGAHDHFQFHSPAWADGQSDFVLCVEETAR